MTTVNDLAHRYVRERCFNIVVMGWRCLCDWRDRDGQARSRIIDRNDWAYLADFIRGTVDDDA